MHFITIFFLLFVMKITMAYEHNVADISVWLSGAAYCDIDKYETMKLAGPATHFTVTNTLHDKKTDLQGYVGFLDNIIYVVFRGSASVLNWIDDSKVIKMPYPYCNCSVHSGFYTSSINIIGQTLASVLQLTAKYPTSNIIVTGHSYGASCAQLISLELLQNNITSSVYNFGQPRIGDDAFSDFANKNLDGNLFRFVHNRDMVPHTPMYNYKHSCLEIFENENNSIIICSNTNCEDPSCSMQYSLTQTNTHDHSFYLGHELDCSTSVSSL